jgi:putative transposase
LFEGRFRASLVATDAYVIACIRYIDLNPLRAGMVADPTAFAWSSCRLHACPAHLHGWVPHPCYLALGPDDATRARAYRELLVAPIPGAVLDSIRTGARRGRPVGNAVDVESRAPNALGSE